jgi:hypothetical protein
VNFVLFSRDGAAGSDEQNRLFLPKNSGLKRPIIIFPTRKAGMQNIWRWQCSGTKAALSVSSNHENTPIALLIAFVVCCSAKSLLVTKWRQAALFA